MSECAWCGVVYDLNPKTEREHLKVCTVFQSLPTAETRSDGKQFVRWPYDDEILMERERIQ